MKAKYCRFTDEEKDFIYKNRGKLTAGEIAEKLNRPYRIINNYMYKNNIQRLRLRTIKKNLNPYLLTERELEVLGLIAKGFSNDEIVEKLFISKTTLSTHINNIYKKLLIYDGKGCSGGVFRVRAVLKYQELVKEGLIDAET